MKLKENEKTENEAACGKEEKGTGFKKTDVVEKRCI